MEYIGEELDLVKDVHNWRSYWGKNIEAYLGAEVLEVGAGLGSNTRHLIKNDNIKRWVCIEPDVKLSSQIEPSIDGKEVEVHTGLLKDYPIDNKFDSILYIDVIEHIEDAESELELAIQYLKPGGHLIILVPAYNFLFNEFDKAIGHFRRYNKKMLRESIPDGMKNNALFYLDSMGFFASLVNKLFLHQDLPSIKQIEFWDRAIVPFSKVTDVFLFRSMGKSLIGVWEKLDH
jgi:SAM-dependent methyltransferase